MASACRPAPYNARISWPQRCSRQRFVDESCLEVADQDVMLTERRGGRRRDRRSRSVASSTRARMATTASVSRPPSAGLRPQRQRGREQVGRLGRFGAPVARSRSCSNRCRSTCSRSRRARSRPAADHDARPARRSDRPAQLRDHTLDHVRSVDLLLTPQGVDQTLRRHGATGLHREHGQQPRILAPGSSTRPGGSVNSSTGPSSRTSTATSTPTGRSLTRRPVAPLGSAVRGRHPARTDHRVPHAARRWRQTPWTWLHDDSTLDGDRASIIVAHFDLRPPSVGRGPRVGLGRLDVRTTSRVHGVRATERAG